MPNFKVFSEEASQLLAQVSNPTAACLLAQVSNLTAASLLNQPSNLTAASLLNQPSNLTAASLLTQVSNLTAASLLTQISNLTAACLVAQMTNVTPASLVMQLGDRSTADTAQAVTATTTAFTNASLYNVISYSDVTFTALNDGPNSAVVQMLLSPDGVNFQLDPSVGSQTIASSSMYFFVPGRFVKYARLQYATAAASTTASLTLFLQAHV